MLSIFFKKHFLVLGTWTSSVICSATWAADPSAKEALELRPVQREVGYETPGKDRLEKCSIHKLATDGQVGWVVREPGGQTLRRFVDTNKDGKLDQWCYYRDGVEVYRDIDGDFNGKADQYRWLGTAGTRWGIDNNEDGRIDAWKIISPEEVTAEVVAAFREKDVERFTRLLISRDELKTLGLDDQRSGDIEKRIETASSSFKATSERQKLISAKTEWTNFGATQPGVLAAGTDGTTKDVIVYENVAAMVDNGGKPAQVAIGTLVQIGNSWRLIDVPGIDNQQTALSHFFLPIPGRTEGAPATENSLSPAMQKLVAQLEEVDEKLQRAKSNDPQVLGAIHTEKSRIIEQLYDASTNPEDRQNWVRQLTESVGAAAQSGVFPDGANRLKSLAEKLEREKASLDLVAYAKFGYLRTSYMLEVQDPKADVNKVQNTWVESLEAFVKDFPNSADTTPEALFQLAIAKEFTGDAKSLAAAADFYGDIVAKFPSSDAAEKAAGAKRRLEIVGKPLALRGRTLDGKAFDLAAYQGTVVVVQYWASWCEPCKQDFEKLHAAQTKFGKRLAIVGVNLDNEAKSAQATLQSAKKVNWPQLFDPGTVEKRGLDGRLANELGIFTLPTMLLVDANGKVVSRNLQAAELDSEIEKLAKSSTGVATRPALPKLTPNNNPATAPKKKP